VSDNEARDTSAIGGWLRLGNYFQLISIIPGAVIVLPVAALIASGAPRISPSAEALVQAVHAANFATWFLLGLTVITVGMIVHPFQFAMTQLLEGYWGSRPTATHLMYTRAALHLHHRRRLDVGAFESTETVSALEYEASMTDEDEEPAPEVPWLSVSEQARLEANLESGEYFTALSSYPDDEFRTLPTRLGNTLRSYEDSIGEPYGLNVIAVVPHLMLIADRSHVDYVNDARGDLDLSIRFVFSWLVLACVSFWLVWPHGAWMLVPIASYGAAWIAYRGAVAAAHEYGTALRVLVDLNYHKLAERLRELDPHGPEASLNRMLSNLAGRA
jgi:hypothetical protein